MENSSSHFEQLLKSFNEYKKSDIFKKAELKKLPRVLSLVQITALYVSCYPGEEQDNTAHDFLKFIASCCKEKLVRPYIDESEPAISYFTCNSRINQPLEAPAHIWITGYTEFEDNEFKRFLKSMSKLPLPEACSLTNWWNDDEVETHRLGDKNKHANHKDVSKVNPKFSNFLNLHPRDVSIAMGKGKAKIVINGESIDIVPSDLGLKETSYGWKILESASISNGDLNPVLKSFNKTNDQEKEAGKIRTTITRLNQTLQQHIGLSGKPIIYDSSYRFIFKKMIHMDLYGENITKGLDPLDSLDKSEFNEKSYWNDDANY